MPLLSRHLCTNKAGKQVVDIAKALVEGGKFNLITEEEYMDWGDKKIRTTIYNFEYKYSFEPRLQICIKNEKDILKAGVFAINTRGELLVLLHVLKSIKEQISLFNSRTLVSRFRGQIYVDNYTSATLVKKDVQTKYKYK